MIILLRFARFAFLYSKVYSKVVASEVLAIATPHHLFEIASLAITPYVNLNSSSFFIVSLLRSVSLSTGIAIAPGYSLDHLLEF